MSNEVYDLLDESNVEELENTDLEIEDLKINPEMDDSKESFRETERVLEEGFNPEYPIIVESFDGMILDGNHRFIAFKEAGRLDEVRIVVH